VLTPTAQIVASAAAAKRGVGAFNVITVEHAEAIVAGAEKARQPVILQISENAVKFHHGRLAPIAAAARAVAQSSTVDVALHLDHIEQLGLLEEALAHGFGSAMFDASTVEYVHNVMATAAAAAFCHRHGLWLEGELGAVGGKGGAHTPGVRTDPREARDYVAATGVDALAVAVGSSHAMTTRSAHLDHELIRALRGAVPVPLVLHGSSGVADEELVAAVRAGIVKVNVGTALNIAATSAVREYLAAEPSAVDPRKYLSRARVAMAATVAHLLGVLASAATVPAAPVPATAPAVEVVG
jgi:fructose-bisphosphate aldolase, class II